MPLIDEVRSVVFVIAPVKGVMKAVGTAFVVRETTGDGLFFDYLVTANHVVEGRKTVTRFNTKDGGTYDEDVPGWLDLPGADVAVAPVERDLAEREGLSFVPIKTESLYQREDTWPRLGERVYFAGLFSLWSDMGTRNAPMVRSGTLGAMYQDRVPVGPRENRRFIQAHLIDCRSHGGFSGSPCFAQTTSDQGIDMGGFVGINTTTKLIGLISAHFDDRDSTRQNAADEDLVDEYGQRINSGVGVVTPSERILEALQMDELRKERERIEGEHRDQIADEGATLDDAGEPDEFARFEDLTRKLVNTPKPDKQEGES
jgi:hypothetical protein